MTGFPLTRVALTTGVELDVAVAGRPGAQPLIFLHGFPESHRTWRFQIPEFARDHFVLAPDQRGYAGSSKPPEVADYSADRIVADVIALADHFGINAFTLVGHDWGGAMAWAVAMMHPRRVKQLIICNAPHPVIFARSLYSDIDQRAASQYMRAFRDPGADDRVAAIGFPAYLKETVGGLTGSDALTEADKMAYFREWSRPGATSAMLKWYRASSMHVPAMDDPVSPPPDDGRAYPKLPMPVLVIWGTQDKALLPCQLNGLEDVIENRTLTTVEAGHFIPWEVPDAVNAAMRDWLSIPSQPTNR